jgi:hypothetical protein
MIFSPKREFLIERIWCLLTEVWLTEFWRIWTNISGQFRVVWIFFRIQVSLKCFMCSLFFILYFFVGLNNHFMWIVFSRWVIRYVPYFFSRLLIFSVTRAATFSCRYWPCKITSHSAMRILTGRSKLKYKWKWRNITIREQTRLCMRTRWEGCENEWEPCK